MSREDIGILEKELYHYIISSGNIEPFVSLYGREKKGGIWKIKNLSISSEDSQSELIKILTSYRGMIFNYIGGGSDFKDLNNGDDGGLFYKIMDETDLNKTNRISEAVETDGIIDFLNTNKFENVFFIIEINLNDSGDKKIILLKSVSQTYYVKKNHFIFNLFDERQKIKFLNNKEYLLLDENFEIAAFVDNSCLFSWNKILGNDSFRLIEFLKQNFGIDWIGTAKIEKIDAGKTIKVSNEKKFLSISLNDKKTKINLKIDDGRTDEFIVRAKNGELFIYSHSFFFITNKKKFEDLYEYHERYEKAYEGLKKELDFIDWSNAKATTPVLRSCYSIANFLRLNECVSKLKTELTSADNNTIKKALKAKKIEYNFKNGKIEIFPQGPQQLKDLLKIITDGVAKTYLLDRDVIGSDFEELT
ncbi:MAG: hypothetical protein WA144_08280 [Candidatus Methanoperedens sp.]